jgi:bifunctional non-homologous end joining protein LigD
MKRKKNIEKEYLTPGGTIPAVHGSKRDNMPAVISPMLATLIPQPFSDPEWIYEIKLDGVRAVCFLKDGKMRLVSRNGKEMNLRYPELAGLTEMIGDKNAILDGEIVALDENGKPSFQRLQSRIGLTKAKEIETLSVKFPVVYYVFDLLYYDRFNLMPAMLIHRKALLRDILIESDSVRFSQHYIGKGEQLFESAQKKRLEGIIAKKQSSLYVQKRSRDWLKIKTVLQQEVVISGYTSPRGSRSRFGALIVGLYRAGELIYVGHVGGGFNEGSLQQVYKMMQPLKTRNSPFAATPKTNEAVQWIRPALVCEVKFSEWTADGKMRQPIFLGLRDDKDPAQCVMES